MNETSTPPTGQPGGYHDGPRVTRDQMKDVRRLRRPRQRVIAGVAAGVARHFDIDPLVVRVVLVVLCFFGGAGLLLYAAGWLLLPEDGAERAPLHLDERSRTVALGGVAVLAALALLGDTWGLYWFPWPLAVIGVVVWFVYQRSQERRWQQPPPGTPGAGYPPHGPYGTTDEPPYAPPYPPTEQAYEESTAQPTGQTTRQPGDDAAVTAADQAADPYRAPTPGPYAPTSPYAAAPLAGQLPYQPPYQSSFQPPYAATPPAPPTAPLPPRPPLSRPRDPRRRGPLLFGFTLALVALAMGILGTVDLAGAQVTGSAYPALALAVVSVMLLVGAFWGRAGGLILLALVASGATVVATANENWETEQVRHAPTSAAEVRDSYELRQGELVVDLSRVTDVEALDGRLVKADIGAGRLEVVVPDDVNVRVNADVGVGAQRVLGESERGGLGISHSYSVAAPDRTAETPLIRLDLDAGVGEIFVRRASDLGDRGEGTDDLPPAPLSLGQARQHDDTRQEALR